MDEDSDSRDEDASSWNAELYFTNANYQAKKMVFLLFINRKPHSSHYFSQPTKGTSDRLVDSPRMKKALEAVYTNILPKGASPFVYLRFDRPKLCSM